MLFSFRGNRNGTTRNTKPRLLACVSLHSACLLCSFLYGLRLWLHIAKRRLELFERYCSSLCTVDRLCNLTNLLLLVVPLLLSSSFSFLSLLHWPCLFSSLSLSLPSPPAFSSLVHSSCPCFRRALHLVDVSVMIVVGFGKLHVINWQTWLPFCCHLVRCVSVKHVCCMSASTLPHNKPYCRLLDDFPEEIWIWCIGIHSSQRNLLCGVHYSLQGTVRCDWKRELDQDSGEWIIGDHIADDWQMEYDCLTRSLHMIFFNLLTRLLNVDHSFASCLSECLFQIGVDAILQGMFGAAAVLITFGGVLGKVSPAELLFVALIETVS